MLQNVRKEEQHTKLSTLKFPPITSSLSYSWVNIHQSGIPLLLTEYLTHFGKESPFWILFGKNYFNLERKM